MPRLGEPCLSLVLQAFGIEDSITNPPASRTVSPTLRCSAAHGTNGFVNATRCTEFPRVWWPSASRPDLLADEKFSSMRCLLKGSRQRWIEEAGAWRSADCLAEGRGGILCARLIARKEHLRQHRQHRQHRLRPYRAPAGVGASQVDSCRRKRDMPDLKAVVLGRLRIHYR